VARGCPKRTVVRCPSGTEWRGLPKYLQWCAALAGYEVGEGVTDALGVGLARCVGVAVGIGGMAGGE
jgi:hypothetical protein